jgi:hypothetical protein
MESGSRSEPLSRSLVRIFSPETRRVFGMGFLFNEREVLTCAHVVESAQSAGAEPICIDFPLLDQPQSPLPTQVRVIRPSARGRSIDAAVLRLTGDGHLPSGSWPARLPYGSDLHGHPWRAFGMPEGLAHPVLAEGVIKASRGLDWQLIGKDGYRVVGGFSGAPVWDSLANAVAGMLYEAEKNPNVKGAFMYPNRVLLEAAGPLIDIYGRPGDGTGAHERKVALLPIQSARPRFRRLRIFAQDPSTSGAVDPTALQGVVLKVRWEQLGPGPVGEYIEVEDVDAAGMRYAPVDLDDPWLVPDDGWAPSESNPQFHQQMVYAVAMKTIEQFEVALGRPILWRPRARPGAPEGDGDFVRLKVRPHALDRGDGVYDPAEVALVFGLLEPDQQGGTEPGQGYACLSYDIIAHETSKAIIDGVFRPVLEPSHPDVHALYTALPAIVALLQHFTIPEVIVREIARTAGDLDAESFLGSLAVELGRTTGRRSILRSAIGKMEFGVWKRFPPDPADLHSRLEPDARAAILVAAVFDAFVAVHRSRTAELVRVATNGTGILPAGLIHSDLMHGLANEAAKSAAHVLGMCIRALDYLPPVDVTFFEFLRALLTADVDVFTSDPRHYRAAFAEAFRRRGIWPTNPASPLSPGPFLLSADSLYWTRFEDTHLRSDSRQEIDSGYVALLRDLKRFADVALYQRDRRVLFKETLRQRAQIHQRLDALFTASPEFAGELGLEPGGRFEVRGLHASIRIRPDAAVTPQVILRVTQSRKIRADRTSGTPAFVHRGGVTLVVDLSVPAVQYRIIKNINSQSRREATAGYLRRTLGQTGVD